ncbi:hypothetical protein [Planomicrobium sp. CPCC 101110]|uniref:hypothetical protein n=1 Tax=Planomicrobium sp. CPCC 101110 TaxID=2599619 RepID=UPI00164853ED|nr:hypothetical protein [Planomicrobium sp. CPCC 101110]
MKKSDAGAGSKKMFLTNKCIILHKELTKIKTPTRNKTRKTQLRKAISRQKTA